MSEADRVRRLAALFGGTSAPGIDLAIGDDAAVLRSPPGAPLVVTVDAQVEGVHFRRAWLGWDDVGYRSFVAAASDVSAMGGAPWCALSALTLPRDFSDDDLDRLARGQRDAAQAIGARVVGGNLSGGDAVTVTTTVLGHAARPVGRSGARPGDGVWLAGEVGLAAAGLAALAAGVTDRRVDAAVVAWRRPRPRVAAGLALGALAHAAIDVSDGVAIDLARLAEASGVGVILDRDALLAAGGDALARAAEAVGKDAFALILGGGEDYALLAASDVPVEGFTRIGAVREGAGLAVRTASGEAPLASLQGFDHFEG